MEKDQERIAELERLVRLMQEEIRLLGRVVGDHQRFFEAIAAQHKKPARDLN